MQKIFWNLEKLTFPAEAQEMTRPAGSVIAIIVLLKVALTCAIPMEHSGLIFSLLDNFFSWCGFVVQS